jgi:glutamate-1-semialdehyde 2,1-aminomutase
MANGYPIAVAYGREEIMNAACQVYFSGTHFYSAVPMAASLTTLEIIRKEGIIDRMNELGAMLKKGLLEQAASHGVEVVYSGPLSIPFMTFKNGGPAAALTFCGAAVKRGVFLHPHHNWFVCAGHTEDDIKQALQATDECFKLVKEKFS